MSEPRLAATKVRQETHFRIANAPLYKDSMPSKAVLKSYGYSAQVELMCRLGNPSQPVRTYRFNWLGTNHPPCPEWLRSLVTAAINQLNDEDAQRKVSQ